MSPLRPLILLVALAACTAEPPTLPTTPLAATPIARSGGSVDTEPHFLVAAPDAPTVANPVIAFWARKGVDRTVRMFYHAAAGSHDSVAFFSIRIRAKSLLRRPDGSAIATGDSVLITLTLADAQHLVVDCQPSGLVFDPKYPATVRLSYANADADDGGTPVPIDATVLGALTVWRHESVTAPWLSLASNELPEANEVEADIGGFTGYALAW